MDNKEKCKILRQEYSRWNSQTNNNDKTEPIKNHIKVSLANGTKPNFARKHTNIVHTVVKIRWKLIRLNITDCGIDNIVDNHSFDE